MGIFNHFHAREGPISAEKWQDLGFLVVDAPTNRNESPIANSCRLWSCTRQLSPVLAGRPCGQHILSQNCNLSTFKHRANSLSEVYDMHRFLSCSCKKAPVIGIGHGEFKLPNKVRARDRMEKLQPQW